MQTPQARLKLGMWNLQVQSRFNPFIEGQWCQHTLRGQVLRMSSILIIFVDLDYFFTKLTSLTISVSEVMNSKLVCHLMPPSSFEQEAKTKSHFNME